MRVARPLLLSVLLKSIELKFTMHRTLYFFNNKRLFGQIFINFIPRRSPLQSRSSRTCSELVGAITEKLAVLRQGKYCPTGMCLAWLDPSSINVQSQRSKLISLTTLYRYLYWIIALLQILWILNIIKMPWIKIKLERETIQLDKRKRSIKKSNIR